MAREIDRDELLAELERGPVRLLDAPGPRALRGGAPPWRHPRAHRRPGSTLAALGEDLDTEIVAYCTSATCSGSALAATMLEGHGYRNVLRSTAGRQDWVDAGLPVENGHA